MIKIIPQQHIPRKRFGQNFLYDAGVIARIISTIHPQPGQQVVEIGPGRGALTCDLLRAAGKLDVVELDRDLIPMLGEMCQGLGELKIHSADALKFDFTQLVLGGTRLRIVGNLPYNISTPLLFHLLEQAAVIQDMHFMLQKEVVERMAASAGDSAYGRLSIMLQYRCAVQRLFIVKPGAFTPAPKVDSAVVRLVPYATPPVKVINEVVFSEVVKQAFSQRRKTLRNTLRSMFTEQQISDLGIEPGLRAQTLSLEQYALLSNAKS